MIEFQYEQAPDTKSATRLFSKHANAKYLGGGTNLVDLMREGIERPEMLVDVTALPNSIETREDGSLLIGAATKNTALAEHRAVRERFPMLAKAILSGASGQIRNMATVGGNVLQRTRCYYFYDDAAHCNKRARGTGCDAINGFNRIHAILGASSHCIATHPSDMCVALAALDATVHLEGPGGARQVKLIDLHRLPGETPDIETHLKRGELITAVELPALSFATRSTYRKVRDRASFAFALVSVAAAIDIDPASRTVRNVRLALGGVAHKPWRATLAEQTLLGAPATEVHFARAAEAELAPAVGLAHNTFKIELAKRVIVATLSELATSRVSRP
jgi:xanthine dehydrogenase YagS FAD-binding subunit